MEAASNYVFFKKKKQEKAEVKEDEDQDKWEVHSDELNRSFNSDDEEEDSLPAQNFLSMGEEPQLMEACNFKSTDMPVFREAAQKKSGGGLFGAIASVFSGGSNRKASASPAM